VYRSHKPEFWKVAWYRIVIQHSRGSQLRTLSGMSYNTRLITWVKVSGH
jgi:hypothetical protein